jgi:hypothetical protein
MSTPLYRNPRAWRARIAQVAIWAGPAALGAIPFNTDGITPHETFWAFVLAALAAGVAIAMEIYLRRYVTAIDVDTNGIVFTTLTTFGRKQIRHGRNEIRHAGSRHDKANFGVSPRVDNQWVALHTTTGKFAYVLDVTPPATIDDKALRKALG